MSYLLDTSTVIDWSRGNVPTTSTFQAQRPSQIKISEVTHFELLYGLFRVHQTKRHTREAIETFLQKVETVPFGKEESHKAAEIRVQLDKTGTPIGAYDLLIAATALAGDHVMVTANDREFKRVDGLQVENWRNPND